MIIYFTSSLFLYGSYLFMEKHQEKLLPAKRTNIVTTQYRLANLVKSGTLALLTPSCVYLMKQLTFSPLSLHQVKPLMNAVGAIYTSTDASALVYNPKCHKSTLIHHLIVQGLYYYCYWNEFNMETTLCRPIAVYCCFSSFAYLVNYRLGIRFSENQSLEKKVNTSALAIYGGACLGNWAYQLYYLMGGLQLSWVERGVYALTLGSIIQDDIFLMRYLKNFKEN